MAQNKYQIKWAANNKPKLKANYIKWASTKREAYIRSIAKRRAKQRGIIFDLEETGIITPEYCPILKIKLEHGIGTGKHGGSSSAPSIDRIDNSKGYTKENIQVISTLASAMKPSATSEQLKLFAEWVLKNES